MKLTSDQKKACNSMAIYVITCCFVYPLIHLFKGDFSWSDTFLYVGANIVVAIIVGGFLILGMMPPKQ